MRPQRGLVVIVGRPNVGKSALFNRLARRQIAIVHDMPGTTRDRIVAEVRHGDKVFDLLDTGGIGVETADPLQASVRTEVDIAVASADLILFTVDSKAGLHPVDLDIGRRLRKSGKKVFLVINKIDNVKERHDAGEFSRLGFDRTFPVSAAHGLGTRELADAVAEQAGGEKAATAAERPVRIAVVGKPNVGKSSLVNRLLEQDRTIVSELAGTTRDAVDLHFTVETPDGPRPYILIDTAGIRHRSKVGSPVEVFSVMRSEKSIERADIVVLVLDSQTGVTNQDKKIAGLVQKALKPMFIIVNKWDLALEQRGLRKAIQSFKHEYEDALRKELFFCRYAQTIFLSAKTGHNSTSFVKALAHLESQLKIRIQTAQLNKVIKTAVDQAPPPLVQNKRLKIYYAVQKTPERELAPPEFILFVNNPDLMTDQYDAYLCNRLREEFRFDGCPIMFELRSSHDGIETSE